VKYAGNPSSSPRLRPRVFAISLMILASTSFGMQDMEPATGPGPMKVIFFTDIHARTEWDTPEALRRAAEAITEQKADLVICGGDMITEGSQSSEVQAAPRWAAYRAMRNAIRPEPIEVIGNHDLVGVSPFDASPPAEDPRTQVRRQLDLTRTYRSLDRNGYHFILLDSIEVTTDKRQYRGFIGPEQMDWLRHDLAQVETHTPIVLVSHIPLLTEVSQIMSDIQYPSPTDRCIVNSREVLDTFRDHHLLVVLQGHLHINEYFRREHTTFITGGSICGEWWRGPWQGTPMGFGVLQLHPDRVEWNYHTYEWIPRRPVGF